MNDTQKSAKTTRVKASQVFSDDERAAMRDMVQERTRARSGKVDGETDVLAKISEMPESDRVIAERIHAIVKEVAPTLSPKTWYGMPAYAKDGKVICFFQSADKFKARFATLGFDQNAKLDEGDMWPTYFGLKKLTPEVEKKIAALVKKAAS